LSGPPAPGTLHPELRLRFGCTLAGAVLLLGLPAVVLLAALAWLPRKTGDDLLAIAAASIPGLILLVSAWVFGLVAFWYRRSSDVLRERRPLPMRVRARRNDRGGLFLELHSLADPGLREPEVRIQVEVPPWDTSDLDGQVVEVHIDDDPKGPVVVVAPRGILWPAPLSRRRNRPTGDRSLQDTRTGPR
jgi:hypothetical protein